MNKKIIFLIGNMATILIMDATPSLYLDLIKRVLINSIYEDPEMEKIVHPNKDADLWLVAYNAKKRENGQDWPSIAHTMVGLKRLNNIQQCAEDILKNNVPGDFAEFGVWRGGSTIFMRAILEAFGIVDRVVWVADSFQGLPVPNPQLYPIDGILRWDHVNFLRVSLEEVKNNFKKYNLLDDQVVFLKGWFKDTVPHAPIQRLALLRLDGDMYESTIDVLNHLYPKLSVGGYVIIDDYNLKGCKMAVDDYRKMHKISTPIKNIDGWGFYWKKEK